MDKTYDFLRPGNLKRIGKNFMMDRLGYVPKGWIKDPETGLLMHDPAAQKIMKGEPMDPQPRPGGAVDDLPPPPADAPTASAPQDAQTANAAKNAAAAKSQGLLRSRALHNLRAGGNMDLLQAMSHSARSGVQGARHGQGFVQPALRSAQRSFSASTK